MWITAREIWISLEILSFVEIFALGFSVHTTGTVTVDGAVEGAIVEAGGDIIITKGVLGDNSAMIKSGRTVRAAYLENCVVYAGTAILADCAINAQLYSDGAIRIVSGRGYRYWGPANSG